MDIHFYLDDEEKTQISSMREMHSNPFKVGDEILLILQDILLIEFKDFTKDHRAKLVAENKKLETKFQCKNVKLVRENKYITFNIIQDAKLTIEYHCTYS